MQLATILELEFVARALHEAIVHAHSYDEFVTVSTRVWPCRALERFDSGQNQRLAVKPFDELIELLMPKLEKRIEQTVARE